MRLGKNFRFWCPVVLLLCLAAYSGYNLLCAHFVIDVSRIPKYNFSEEIKSTRGGIYCASLNPENPYPLVRAAPSWKYSLDPVAMTQQVVTVKLPTGEKKVCTPQQQAKVIEYTLGITNVQAMVNDFSNKYQFLKVTDDPKAYNTLCERKIVAGVIAEKVFVSKYFEGNRLCHVLGGINAQGEGVGGLQGKFDHLLRGVPGKVEGFKDGNGNIIVEKTVSRIEPKQGCNIYLTVVHALQKVVEEELAKGVAEFGAAAGWCVILDVETGKVLAMASNPDFYAPLYNKYTDNEKMNRVIGLAHEPGSVLKTITAASAIDAGFVTPSTIFSTDRLEKNSNGQIKYYNLPKDSHAMAPKITLTEAIVESSNVAIGKLGYDFTPKRLREYLIRFGLAKRTGIELPGESAGYLPDAKKWDKASWSRVPIGQAISFTPLQVASAYQTIANDGLRMPPYIIDKIVDSDGNTVDVNRKSTSTRVISPSAARQTREMMLGVSEPGGTAKRAKVPGYSVASKTGTAQKPYRDMGIDKLGYVKGLFYATYCGIIPSGVVKRYPTDEAPVPPKVVILVGLDFCESRPFHQGGNSSGPIFKRIAQKAMLYLEVEPDRPDEKQPEDDEFL